MVRLISRTKLRSHLHFFGDKDPSPVFSHFFGTRIRPLFSQGQGSVPRSHLGQGSVPCSHRDKGPSPVLTGTRVRPPFLRPPFLHFAAGFAFVEFFHDAVIVLIQFVENKDDDCDNPYDDRTPDVNISDHSQSRIRLYNACS